MELSRNNPIRTDILSIPSLIETSASRVFKNCRDACITIKDRSIKRIIITGCGYSYAAALATKEYLKHITSFPVQISPAIDVARFSSAECNDFSNSLLVSISNSGEVSRINEGAAFYKKRGATVIGLTSNRESTLCEHVDAPVDISVPSLDTPLPLRGYIMSILALIGTGHAIAGTHSCLYDTSEETIQLLLQSSNCLKEYISEIDSNIYQFVWAHQALQRFEFVGSGYERAAAFLGKIEMMGQAGIIAIDEDAEQWCHCNFFMANPETIGTMLLASLSSPAASRSLEALSYMRHLKRPLCVVTDDPSLISDPQMTVIHTPPITPLNAGIIQMTVPSLLTGYVCKATGEIYARGFRDQWNMFKDGRGTCKSEIIVL